jgi:hypothetical protein
VEYNEHRPHSSLGYRTPAEFARVAITQSYGKDVGSAHLENASGVSPFPTAPAAGLDLQHHLYGIRGQVTGGYLKIQTVGLRKKGGGLL